MNKDEKAALADALEAIASALSFAKSDVPEAMADQLRWLDYLVSKFKEAGDE